MYLQYRRFVNLIVRDLENSIYSLRRINLSKNLFDQSPDDAQAASVKTIRRWNDLAKPEIRFEKPPSFSTTMSESCILFADSAGRTAAYDTNINCLSTMPSFNFSKGPNSICFSTRQHVAYTKISRGLYVMDLFPATGKNSSFELLSYFEDNVTSLPPAISNTPMARYWCDLPLPPFVGNPAYQSSTYRFSSTVVNAKTLLVSSIEEGIGTYIFDTHSRVWSQAGNWLLPFYGKAEFLPEFNLWFGLSRSCPHSLCCFDLCTIDHDRQPELQHTWYYLDLQVNLPEPYKRDLVYLGSGRFCVVSFFKMIDEDFADFTGVQLVPCKDAESPVRMIKHKSIRYYFESHRIEAVL